MAEATVEELKAAWEYLPDHACFAGHFETELEEVAAAKRNREAIWKGLVQAAATLEEAENALCETIRRTMERNWTPEQITGAASEMAPAGAVEAMPPLRIARDGQEIGAWPLAVVQGYLTRGELKREDVYYDAATGKWRQLTAAALKRTAAEQADRIRRAMATEWTPETMAAAAAACDGKEGAES